MQAYEFRVIPAPRRGEKARGLKTTEERFALALTLVMNDMAAQGWEFLRAETLPCDERAGLTGTKTAFHNLLVFRRALSVDLLVSETAAPQMAASQLEGPRLGPATMAPVGAAPSLGPAEA